MSLAQKQQILADTIKAGVSNADPVAAVVPVNPAPWSIYVWPGDEWVTRDESFCDWSVGLNADIVAGVTDLAHSQVWLADRVVEVLTVARDGIDLDGDVVEVERVDRPVIVRTVQGAELIVVRVEFTRFTMEV